MTARSRKWVLGIFGVLLVGAAIYFPLRNWYEIQYPDRVFDSVFAALPDGHIPDDQLTAEQWAELEKNAEGPMNRAHEFAARLGPDAAPGLVRAILASKTVWTQAAAMNVLLSMPDTAWVSKPAVDYEGLMKYVTDENRPAYLRVGVMEILALWKHEPAKPLFTTLMNHPDPDVRAMAIRLIGRVDSDVRLARQVFDTSLGFDERAECLRQAEHLDLSDSEISDLEKLIWTDVGGLASRAVGAQRYGESHSDGFVEYLFEKAGANILTTTEENAGNAVTPTSRDQWARLHDANVIDPVVAVVDPSGREVSYNPGWPHRLRFKDTNRYGSGIGRWVVRKIAPTDQTIIDEQIEPPPAWNTAGSIQDWNLEIPRDLEDGRYQVSAWDGAGNRNGVYDFVLVHRRGEIKVRVTTQNKRGQTVNAQGFGVTLTGWGGPFNESISRSGPTGWGASTGQADFESLPSGTYTAKVTVYRRVRQGRRNILVPLQVSGTATVSGKGGYTEISLAP